MSESGPLGSTHIQRGEAVSSLIPPAQCGAWPWGRRLVPERPAQGSGRALPTCWWGHGDSGQSLHSVTSSCTGDPGWGDVYSCLKQNGSPLVPNLGKTEVSQGGPSRRDAWLVELAILRG